MRNLDPDSKITSLDGARGRIYENLCAGARLRDEYRRRPLIGTFLIELPAPRTVRSLALAGFDFVILDLEHSSFGLETLALLIAEAQAVNLPALVRVWTADGGLIGKVLDMGADGVMVPRIQGVEQAADVLRSARYTPIGERGLAPLITYATAPENQVALGDKPLVLLQLESKAAFADAEAMMALPGIDGVFVGPYDLSQALGSPGEVNSPQVIAEAGRLVSQAPPNMMLGVYVDDPAWSAQWIKRGFRFQCVSFDGRMMLESAQLVLSRARGQA